MNPESASLETPSELEELPARSREELLHTSVQDIRAMDNAALERFHNELLPYLGKPEKPAAGFSEYAEKLPAAKQKQLNNPAVRAEYLRGYLEARLSTLRSPDAVTAQRRAAIERSQTIDERQTMAERFAHEAELQIEHRFVDWGATRQVVDTNGRPMPLQPRDQFLVDKIEQQQHTGQEFHDVTARLEVGFADGLKRFQTFGDEASVVVQPSTKYDDFANGVDMIARIQPTAESDQEIVLGIDFTITTSDFDIAKKLQRNSQHPVRSTHYGTRDLPKGLQYFPVVLAVDRKRAERITKHEAIVATAARHDGGKKYVTESIAELEYAHDAAVFRYAVLEEAVAQLNVQAASLPDRGVNEETQRQYEAAITYLESILAERKNLQALAGLETSLEKSVYRVTDTAFIRSASESNVGYAASPAA